MKERGLLCNAEMVRAYMDGRKTVTRRPIEPQPNIHFNNQQVWPNKDGGWSAWVDGSMWYDFKCPYGVPGDRLYVRETWKVGAWDGESQSIAVDYQADGFIRKEWLHVPDEEMFERLWIQSSDDADNGKTREIGGVYSWKPGEAPTRWRPSIHMPRWASRITLEITAVRVERVQEISYDDILAEGIKQKYTCLNPGTGSYANENDIYEDYSTLWDTLYGKKYPWSSNPWVWAIETVKL